MSDLTLVAIGVIGCAVGVIANTLTLILLSRRIDGHRDA